MKNRSINAIKVTISQNYSRVNNLKGFAHINFYDIWKTVKVDSGFKLVLRSGKDIKMLKLVVFHSGNPA